MDMFFTELWVRVFNTLLIPIRYFWSEGERLYWLYLVSAAIIAVFFYAYTLRTQGFPNYTATFTYLRSIILHRSSRVDVAYFFVNRIFMVVIIIPVIFKLHVIQTFVTDTLGSSFSISPITLPYPLLASIAFTFLALIVSDFFIFFSHYLQHKVPYFWEFHKVHHSAEVLTPMTEYRMHPIDDILALTIGMVASSIFYGCTTFLFGSSIELITVANLNIFIFLFYLLGFHLRHSPVFISYGKFWERIFISPATHQIHHSSKKEHHDRNFGFIFSFWDQMFGSLVMPERNMHLTYGIGGEEKEMQSVAKLYFRPFKKCLELMRKNKK